MQTENKGKYTSLLFVILLFLSLGVCALFSVLIGSGVYGNIADSMEDNFQGNTSLSYISNKVRQSDANGAIYVETLEGQNVLTLEEDYDGIVYQTRIYYYDGYIKELYTDESYVPDLEFGESIIEAAALDFEQVSPDLISVKLTTSMGAEETMLLAVRSSGGGDE